MNLKNAYYFTGILVIIFILYFFVGTRFFANRSDEKFQNEGHSELSSGVSQTSLENDSSKNSIDEAVKITLPKEQLPAKTLSLENISQVIVYPEVEELRKQVAANPHLPPAGVTDFARSLAPYIVGALKNDAKRSDVEAVGKELKKCITSGPTQSLQALCLYNLQRISKQHPMLKSLSNEELQVSPRIREMVKLLEN